MNKCVILGAGEYGANFPAYDKNDFYIAADGGFSAAERFGIKPNLLIGDFDSLKTALPQDIKTVSLPVNKDVTDMDAAVSEGIRLGYNNFELYGGTGGRPDHTFANLSLLARLSQNKKRAVLFGSGFIFTAVTNDKIKITCSEGKTLSLFSWTDTSQGVTTTGVQYPLNNKTLLSSFALGVSNSFTKETAEISVENGTLIVMSETPSFLVD
ncbi:MAG: thiamine diphosphokinase [Oscillospiraceae bacterium]|nr:thiamine diphosphokinase [Oscillospiraceae bacterium]